MLSMKKFWAIISLWLGIVFGTIIWAARTYAFTPTFPYYELTASYPRVLSTLSNFDGVNYLRLSTNGYPENGGEVAFFPLYPLLIHGLINLGLSPLPAALILNFFFLLLFFLIFFELDPKNSSRFLLLFLSFPTSFFLLGVYTESLFIFLFIAFIASLKLKRWWFAAIIAALASGTRFVGVIFGPILLIEYFRHQPSPISRIQYSILLLLSELGFLAYMYYLSRTTGDPLAFIHVQPQFGMGRSGGEIILLPQVLYRYLRMLLTLSPQTLIYYRVLWELGTFIFFSGVLFKYWSKLGLADKLYSTWVLLLPTFSGTLSSFPRYELVALPLFLVLARYARLRSLYLLVVTNLSLLIFYLALFTRGLFVA